MVHLTLQVDDHETRAGNIEENFWLPISKVLTPRNSSAESVVSSQAADLIILEGAAAMIQTWAVIMLLVVNTDLAVSNLDISKIQFFLTNPLDPELYYNAMELICNEGYPVQQHKTLTEDGYILNMHRIPHGNRKERFIPRRRGFTKFHHYVHPDYYECVNDSLHEKPTGPPVLLQHGFIAASDSWVLQGAGRDLAYLLADAGYDVWMSDVRGNFYSRAHLYKSTRSKEYWDFSWHEIGHYDLPAVIDYILSVTNHKQLYYVGHSMGTSVFFVMGSTRPEYMSKIRLASLLAPVGNVTSNFGQPPLSIVFNFTERALIDLDRKQIYEFATRVNWVPLVINRFCSQKSFFQDFCYDIGVSLDGHPYYNLIRKTFARSVSHFLSGASSKTLFHYAQLVRAQQFRFYDYGEKENLKWYGQSSPPEYDLRTVTAPVAIIYSDSDLFVDAEQAEVLAKRLPNVVFVKRLSRFLHTDFIIARNAKDKVYDDVIALIKKY